MNRRLNTAPTLNDIALSAGVSKYTVSVVLNGARSNTRVSEETRARIHDVARRLGYHPNAMAQGLMRRRINTIGVLFGPVVPSVVLANPYASGLLQGIVTEAARHRFDVILFSEPWKPGARSTGPFRDGRTDGVILVAPLANSDVVESLAEAGVRAVAVAYPGEQYGVPSVDIDNAAGVRAAVEHLIALGHKRIAHLSGPEDMVSVPVRRDAFRAVMAEAGLAVPDTYLYSCGYDGDQVPEATRTLLSLPDPPTAVFAGNDTIAMAVMATAREEGRCIPDDLSVVGFDDTPTAALVTPALTTVRQSLPEIGQQAMQLLRCLIEDETVEARAYLHTPELVVRASTAAPKAQIK